MSEIVEVSSKLCQICKTVKNKYRCPRCAVKYCSKDCFKLHRETSCVKVDVDIASMKPATSALEPVASTTQFSTTEVSLLLSEKQKNDLSNNQVLKKLCGSKRLRAHLEQIDSAPDRLSALRNLRTQSSNFDEITSLILSIVCSTDSQSI